MEVISFFLCIPGTHNDAVSTSSGFVVDLSQADKDKIIAHQKLKKKPLVKIPPGCMLIFNERLIHEVVPKRHQRLCYVFLLDGTFQRLINPMILDQTTM